MIQNLLEWIVPDVYQYRPTKEEWERDDWFQRAAYRSARKYAFFGICSARWKRLAEAKKERGSEQ